ATATLFVSNTGFDVGPPEDESPVVEKATVLRLELSIPEGKPPTVTRQTVIASGLSEQADKDVFIVGPTGLALGKGGVLYVSDSETYSTPPLPSARPVGPTMNTSLSACSLRPLAITVCLVTVGGLPSGIDNSSRSTVAFSTTGDSSSGGPTSKPVLLTNRVAVA